MTAAHHVESFVKERYARGPLCGLRQDLRLDRQEPYRASFHFVEPRVEILLTEAAPFDCQGTRRRDPRETKGEEYDATTEAAGACCGPEGCC